jgi:hypothetical protein
MHGFWYSGGIEINATEKQNHSSDHVRMEGLGFTLDSTDTYGLLIDFNWEMVSSKSCTEAKVHFRSFERIDVDGSMVNGSKQRNPVLFELLCP